MREMKAYKGFEKFNPSSGEWDSDHIISRTGMFSRSRRYGNEHNKMTRRKGWKTFPAS